MLTNVDETLDATVWAQSKWKGVFKVRLGVASPDDAHLSAQVRWQYIRDIPNQALRHIRLTNTAEAKPVCVDLVRVGCTLRPGGRTSSRDTQECPYEAGLEILRIFSTYNSRTSLLQVRLAHPVDLDRGAEERMAGLLLVRAARGATTARQHPRPRWDRRARAAARSCRSSMRAWAQLRTGQSLIEVC
jgi:hypothetical protein